MVVGRVLPHWFDALLEEMIVGADLQITRFHDIIVNAPKVLDGIKGDKLLESHLPGVGICFLARIIKPQCPGGVERVLCVEVDGIVKDGDVLAIGAGGGDCEVVVLSHGVERVEGRRRKREGGWADHKDELCREGKEGYGCFYWSEQRRGGGGCKRDGEELRVERTGKHGMDMQMK